MKFAIFNGLSFHYEMYGYILNFCKKFNYQITIYSNINTHYWKEFYEELFLNIEWKELSLFSSECKLYDYIFLTTDDDRNIIPYINNIKNIISIDHYFNIRNTINLFYHIATRPFIKNYRKWALPCYPIIESVIDKVNIISNNDTIHIAIVGGNNDYDINRINRISSLSKINLHLISRRINSKLLLGLDKKFIINIYENILTSEMINIVKICKYIMCDMTTNIDHINGLSMSGSIPLAFSNLSRLLISSKNNSLYNFNSVLTFDIDSEDLINIDNNEDYQLITQKVFDERNILIDNFHNIMNEIVINDIK